jgi:regulator of sigma E protease
MSILIFLAIIIVLVVAHEFGHFIVAKKLGIWVQEFAFVFPPRLWSKKKGETTYAINALPFGGYVKLYGEQPDAPVEESMKHRSFSHSPKWKQVLVLVAGVCMNLIVAIVLFSIASMTGMQASSKMSFGGQVQNAKLVVTEVITNSPAEKAGMKTGDTIISVTNDSSRISADSPKTVQNLVALNNDKPLTFTVTRAGVEKTIKVVPVAKNGDTPKIGIGLDMIGTLHLKPYQAVMAGTVATYYTTIETVQGLGQLIGKLFTGGGALDNVTGPVGLVKATKSAASFGLVYLLTFTAMISVNLAVINLVPIPALDGGKILIIAIEKLIRRPIAPKVQMILQLVGVGLLLLLMIVVTIKDFIK